MKMEPQKSLKDFNYHFRGNLNTATVTYGIVFIIPIFLVLLIISMSLSSIIAKLIGVAVVLSLLIYFFIKFDSESDLILFCDDEMVHFKKKVMGRMSYSELQEIEIVKRRKRLTQVDFRIKENKFSVSIETKSFSNFTYEQFAEFLLKQNHSIVVIEDDNYKKFRYTLEKGEINKTSI
ncbi:MULTISPECIES: hypothetical protein [Flavobacterium]|uniref:Uncharacterized protein n=1 Tax=Flavobacterium hankyongi TaxID=1176532 RepID=A0ABP9A5E4_9FLAO|nr:hypothetical protein [Flavobacterium sp. N1846]